jgi:hypothetical protein
MQAAVGDRLRIRGRNVGDPERIGVITGVLGPQGAPPYRVRFAADLETVVMPDAGVIVEPSRGREATP